MEDSTTLTRGLVTLIDSVLESSVDIFSVEKEGNLKREKLIYESQVKQIKKKNIDDTIRIILSRMPKSLP